MQGPTPGFVHTGRPGRPGRPRGVCAAPGGQVTPGHAVFSFASCENSPSVRPATEIRSAPHLDLAPARGQQHDLLQHAAKQPPGQVTLRQQQPVAAGIFNQTPAGFHQPPACRAPCLSACNAQAGRFPKPREGQITKPEERPTAWRVQGLLHTRPTNPRYKGQGR